MLFRNETRQYKITWHDLLLFAERKPDTGHAPAFDLYQSQPKQTWSSWRTWRLLKWACGNQGNGPQLRSVHAPPPQPLVDEAAVLHEACVYVSLGVFPPTVLHPILHNKGAWGSGLKWEWAHEWKGTNWHVAFCEVGAQPLDRRLPFANERCGLCVSAFLSASLQNVLSPPRLCAAPELPAGHRRAVNWETHTSVIKAAGGLVLYQSPSRQNSILSTQVIIVLRRFCRWQFCHFLMILFEIQGLGPSGTETSRGHGCHPIWPNLKSACEHVTFDEFFRHIFYPLK